MKPVSGVAPEIQTALPRADAGAVDPSVAPLQANLARGSFAYRVPVEVAADRGGRKPEVGLDYDPRRHGNGAFGMGWDVPIVRIERRLDLGVPRYDASDRFSLSDGTLLEQVAPGEYRPTVERGFRRIRRAGLGWEVVETDGTRLAFGETSESQLLDPSRPERVAAWFISSVEDPDGNVTRYRYERDLTVTRPEGHTAAQIYLRRIEYLGLPGQDHLCAVQFDYQATRPDAWTSFRRGFPVRTNWLCHQIVSFAADLDAAAARVVNFGGAPYDVALRAPEAPDHYLASGLYLWSSPGERSLRLEWPIPSSQVVIDLDVPAAGGTYRISETRADGSVVIREENAGPGYRLQLGDRVRRVDVVALRGPLVIRLVTQPPGRVPEVVARYQLTYASVVTELPVDPAGVAPPAKHLTKVERLGYDDALQEARLPPVSIDYTPFSLAGVYPRPLRGSPAKPLGAVTTPLSFFGTGRPDLVQTDGGHRVYWNRGRMGAEIVVERRELAASPSLALGDAGVFLRDVEGKGGVDLTSTAYYYRNPAKLGQVSRSAPSWGPSVDFDPVERHPQLSPEEVRRSRALDLDGDGRIDLLTTSDGLWEWRNLGDGAWAPGRRVARRPSFGDKHFPDISFDDAGIFIADMNGDGLDEIVRVAARKVEYWSRAGDGWSFKTTMANSPRWADFEPDRVILADLTGTGAADLVYLTGNGLEIILNCGGTAWAEPIHLDFRDTGLSRGIPMPSSAAAALVVDLLGDGTRGLLWSFERADLEPNYFFLPLAAAGKPFLLRGLENGTGGRLEVDYTTSSLQAAEDEAQGRPWAEEPPYPVTLVGELREIDLVTGDRLVRRLRYRDGYYDRDDRELRAFGTVEETVVGTATRRGSRLVHQFGLGRPTSSAPADKAQARALAGMEIRTDHHDLETGALLRRIDRYHEVAPVHSWVTGPGGAVTLGPPLTTTDGAPIVMAYERYRLESDYEGTTSPRHALFEQSRLVQAAGGPVLEEFGRTVSETTWGEVTTAGAGTPVGTFEVEGTPVALRPADAARQRRVEYEYATNRGANIVQYWCRQVTLAGAGFHQLVGEKRRHFDGGTAPGDHLPFGSVLQGNVQREETLVAKWSDLRQWLGAGVIAHLHSGQAPAHLVQMAAADGAQAWFSVDRRRVFQHAAGRIAFGQVLREVDARGAITVRQYDAADWHIRREQNGVGQWTDHTSYCTRAGKPRRTTFPSGSRTETSYDAFGRPTSTTEDAAAAVEPQSTTRYDTAAYSVGGTPVAEIGSRLIDAAEAPRRYVVEVRYFDGWGRLLQTRRTSDSHAGDLVATDRRYGAGGKEPSFESLPYWSAGLAYVAPVGRNGKSQVRDALSRVVGITFADGAQARLDYAPWQVTVHDPEDLRAGSPVVATPTVFRYDHARQVVEISDLVRHGDGQGSEVLASSRFTFDATNRMIRATDARGTATDLVYDARGDLVVVRHADGGEVVRLFDAGRRRLYERNAAGDQWWFLCDALGRVLGEIAGVDPAQAPQVTYAYDGPGATTVGHLGEARDLAAGTHAEYSYDGRGNVTRESRSIAGALVADDQRSYNDLNAVARRDFASGASLEYVYGTDGLLLSTRFVQPGGVATRLIDGVAYHPSGRTERAALCGGQVSFKADFGLLSHRLVGRSYRSALGAPLYELDQIVHDGVGNLLGFRENAPPAPAVTWVLATDSLYRLRSADAQRPAGAVAHLEYRYDLGGNFTRNDELAPGQALAYDTHRPDLLAGFPGTAPAYRYDAVGRLVASPTHGTILWNARDRVDRLVAGGAPQLDMLHDHAKELLAVDRAAPGGAERLLLVSPEHERHAGVDHYFAFLDGLQCVAARDDGTLRVLARGLAGSIPCVIDGNGVVVPGSSELYAPFGAALEPAAIPWPRGFAGAIRAQPPMYLMGERPYLAGAGRFGAVDRVLLEPPDRNLLLDARRISPYLYGLGSPHTHVDPSGRIAFVDDAIFWGIGRLTGLRHDSFGSGVLQNFLESWSVLLRTMVPLHEGQSPFTQAPGWLLQNSWGMLNEAVGTVAAYGAVELFGATTQMWEHVQLITVPGSFGAFTLGNKVIGDATTLSLYKAHEQGHYFQNLLLGPLYFPVVAIPSIIHAGVHPNDTNYDHFYTEGWATSWGK